jgi:hypothetical protein
MHQTTTRPRHLVRWGLLAVLALAMVFLLSGCFGGGKSPNLTPDQFTQLGKDMAAIEQLKGKDALENRSDQLNRQLRDENNKQKKDQTEISRLNYLLGYLAEYREAVTQPDPNLRDYKQASDFYGGAQKSGSVYANQAAYRLGVLGALKLLQTDDLSLKTAGVHAISADLKDRRLYGAADPRRTGRAMGW